MENRGTKDASEAMRHVGARPCSCHLGSRAMVHRGGLRAIVSGTMDIGEMVRHKDVPQSSSHGFCGPLLWDRPCGVLGTVPLPTDAEHQGLLRRGSPERHDTDPSSLGFFGPLREATLCE